MNSQQFAITPLKYCETQPSIDIFRIIAQMEVSFGFIHGFIFGVNYFAQDADDSIEGTFQIFIGILAIEIFWNEAA